MAQPFDKPIYVTRPYLPPLEEYAEGLREIWNNVWVTNDGPVLNRFRRQLSEYVRTDNTCLFTNGTLALQLGLQGMGISGEAITTPFTAAATTSALFSNRIRPVFVDIEPEHYTLDPDRVENAITSSTRAILAVHVFGFPCRLQELADIACRHNIALIYDAAHAFGVEVGGKPIAHFGDMSMFSFHATKVFHSIEGGLLTFRDSGLLRTFETLRNYGFMSEVEIAIPGTNARMNEMQALMGTLVLGHMDEMIEKRRQITDLYRERLGDVPGIHLCPPPAADIRYNYPYMPIEVDKWQFGLSRDALYEELKHYNIFARRYFYPLVNDFECFRGLQLNDPLDVARKVAGRILCLPIYCDLALEHVERICETVRFLRNN